MSFVLLALNVYLYDSPWCAHVSFATTALHGFDFTGNAIVVAYAAIIEKLDLPIPQHEDLLEAFD